MRRKPCSFFITTLGCPKNLTDSEKLAGVLIEAGWVLRDEPENCDIVILNTCAFIPPAREEAYERIETLKRLKERRRFRFLVVGGCLPLYHRDDRSSLPSGVDMYLSPSYYKNAPLLFRSLLESHKRTDFVAPIKERPDDTLRVVLTPPHYAYLRISDGCSNRCSFCRIPEIRGIHRPKRADVLLGEVEALASLGVKELIVVGQDTTAYRAPDTDERLPSLLRCICKVDGVEWIRLMYTHPAKITQELVDVMAGEPKIVRYIDMPVQHINERILRLMGRAGGAKAIKTALRRLRSIDGMVVRTTVMVGFPTETEDEFKELMEFIEEMCFERLGVFTYYPEPQTKAAELPQLPYEVAQERANRLMELQQKIAFRYTEMLLCREERTILDGFDGEGYTGRTYRDAPQIDAVCKIRTDRRLKIGSFLKVHFVEADGYDIIAEVV